MSGTRSSIAPGRGSISGADCIGTAGMLATILALNLAGWGIFALAVLPHHFQYRGLGIGIGVGFTAWTLGARHAFDADHIAAIDNSTRKLISDGKRPLGTGFFFALGHSSIVVLVGIGITIAARSVLHVRLARTSGFDAAGGVIGTDLSASFLCLIAGLNLVVFARLRRIARDMHRGHGDRDYEAQLQASGLMWRLFGRWLRVINHSWQMFLVGFVFGIGVDTATEVVLLAGAASAATEGLPWFAVLTLPLLFAGGMTLFDTLDGPFMNRAYDWASARPARSAYYNLMITGLSVVIAFLVGAIEIIGLLTRKLNLHGSFSTAVANIDLNRAGIPHSGSLHSRLDGRPGGLQGRQPRSSGGSPSPCAAIHLPRRSGS